MSKCTKGGKREMKNVTSIGDVVSVIGNGENLRIGRRSRRMTALVCMSIMVFFAMALMLSIASADRPDYTVYCEAHNQTVGKFNAGMCWSWWPFGCHPCDSQDVLNKRCNNEYPACEDRCTASSDLGKMGKPCPTAPC